MVINLTLKHGMVSFGCQSLEIRSRHFSVRNSAHICDFCPESARRKWTDLSHSSDARRKKESIHQNRSRQCGVDWKRRDASPSKNTTVIWNSEFRVIAVHLKLPRFVTKSRVNYMDGKRVGRKALSLNRRYETVAREIDRTDTREERTEREGESDPLLSPLRNVPPLSWNRLEEGGGRAYPCLCSLHSPLSLCLLFLCTLSFRPALSSSQSLCANGWQREGKQLMT